MYEMKPDIHHGSVEEFNEDLERYETSGLFGGKPMTHEEALEYLTGSEDVFEVEIPIRTTYRCIVAFAKTEEEAIKVAQNFIKHGNEDFNDEICCGAVDELDTTPY